MKLHSRRRVTSVAEREVGVNKSAFQPNLFTGSGAAYTYGFPLTPGGAAPSIINLSYVQACLQPVQTAQVKSRSRNARKFNGSNWKRREIPSHFKPALLISNLARCVILWS